MKIETVEQNQQALDVIQTLMVNYPNEDNAIANDVIGSLALDVYAFESVEYRDILADEAP
jgi:hypothetical protein